MKNRAYCMLAVLFLVAFVISFNGGCEFLPSHWSSPPTQSPEYSQPSSARPFPNIKEGMLMVCPSCRGKGFFETESKCNTQVPTVCSICKGSGWEAYGPVGGGGVRSQRLCSGCGGSGTVMSTGAATTTTTRTPCQRCGASGYIQNLPGK